MEITSFNIFLLLSILLFSPVYSQSEDIYYNHTSSDTNLYFVFTTYRHGARYPFVHTDYFGNPIPARGALTTYGGIQHLEIGKKYRERYSNFLDMDFNPKQMYIRSSDVERTVISTLKELEGLFNRSIERKNLHIIPNGLNFWELYQLNKTERQEREKYFNFCNNKNKKRFLPNINDIMPILKNCYGINKAPNVGGFCDSVYTAYFQYVYSNQTDNKIGKCGRENADKMHEFCVNTFNTYRGWDEAAAYMFYNLYQNIFRYMFDAIEGRSELKMVMIGGHDITVDKFMNFLDGLKIIPRTHYPHYACNIVIELRKYSDEFYLEFYYNDILKYNETLQYFMDTLDNSKFSNLYNYCGLPPWAYPKTTQIITEIAKENEINTTHITQETIQNTNNIIKNTLENEKISTTIPLIEETTTKEIISTTQIAQETTQKEVIATTNIVEEEIKNIPIPTTNIHIVEEIIKKVETSLPHIPEKQTEEIELIPTKDIKKEEEEEDENEELINEFGQINNLTNTSVTQENKTSNSTFTKAKEKLKKFFKQDSDLNLYIILITIAVIIITIIIFIILMRYIIKRRKKFTRLAEEQAKSKADNNNINNISID